MNAFLTIATISTVLMMIFGLIGDGPKTYRFAILFLAPLLWSVYGLRHKWRIHPFHFAIFAAALLLHDLGAFGFYRRFYFGLEFDTYVHFTFGVAGGFLVARALWFNAGLRSWKLGAATILIIMGTGALHELLEYATTLALGPEKGMLKANDPDRFDTQKDLANNLTGCLTALALRAASCALEQRWTRKPCQPSEERPRESQAF